MSGTRGDHSGVGQATRAELFRWECRCQPTPVLLATYDRGGHIHIKARDRYWHIRGTVRTICPRCGAEHALDLRVEGPRGREVDTQS